MHVKCQQQILASGGGEPLGGAHGVILAAAPAIGRLETALDNLALAATNKKLVDAATHRGGTPAATPGRGWTQAATPVWG